MFIYEKHTNDLSAHKPHLSHKKLFIKTVLHNIVYNPNINLKIK